MELSDVKRMSGGAESLVERAVKKEPTTEAFAVEAVKKEPVTEASVGEAAVLGAFPQGTYVRVPFLCLLCLEM